MRIVGGIQYREKRRNKTCVVYGCTHKVYFCKAKSGNKTTSIYCPKHRREHEKESNPLVYWFGVLKQNARRRCKVFTLTLEDFRSFCEHTNYLKLKGKECGKYTIDRIREDKGYEVGNIQILEHGQNCRKYHIDKRLQEKYGSSFAVQTILTDEEEYKPVINIDDASPF